MIELRTLGGLSLRHDDGCEVRSILAQPKRFALLAYLSSPATPEFSGRETLSGLFWTDMDPERARSALRSSLYFLRRSLGDGVILARGEHEVGTDPNRLHCDATEFERKLHLKDSRAALAIYRGEYLDGLGADDAPGFERWLEDERARLQRGARDAARELARALSDRGESRQAERWARQALMLDPWDEAMLRLLMESLVRDGNLPGALRAFESFSERMREDLELEPSVETRVLATRLREARRPRPAPQMPADPSARDQAMEWMRDLRARQTQVGIPGVGATGDQRLRPGAHLPAAVGHFRLRFPERLDGPDPDVEHPAQSDPPAGTSGLPPRPSSSATRPRVPPRWNPLSWLRRWAAAVLGPLDRGSH